MSGGAFYDNEVEVLREVREARKAGRKTLGTDFTSSTKRKVIRQLLARGYLEKDGPPRGPGTLNLTPKGKRWLDVGSVSSTSNFHVITVRGSHFNGEWRTAESLEKILQALSKIKLKE